MLDIKFPLSLAYLDASSSSIAKNPKSKRPPKILGDSTPEDFENF
jgi:hypothetical protein